jgi:hypothetical protein
MSRHNGRAAEVLGLLNASGEWLSGAQVYHRLTGQQWDSQTERARQSWRYTLHHLSSTGQVARRRRGGRMEYRRLNGDAPLLVMRCQETPPAAMTQTELQRYWLTHRWGAACS